MHNEFISKVKAFLRTISKWKIKKFDDCMLMFYWVLDESERMSTSQQQTATDS